MNLELVSSQLIELNAKYPAEGLAQMEAADDVTLKVFYNVKFSNKDIQSIKGFEFPARVQLSLSLDQTGHDIITYIAECIFSVRNELVGETAAGLTAQEISFLSYPYARQITTDTLISLGLPTVLPYAPPQIDQNQDM